MNDFLPGEKLFTVGLNMQCKKVVASVSFVRMHEDGRCVTKSKSGILVIGGKPDEYFRNRADVKKFLAK